MAGGVVHFELPADDENRAREFYTSVFGWGFQVMPEMDYSLAMTTPMGDDGRPAVAGSINGGLFRRSDLTTPVVTVDVEDIDDALRQIVALGGSVHREKMEVPGMGWNAYFKDTEGNVVGLWQNVPDAGEAPGDAPAGSAGNDIGA